MNVNTRVMDLQAEIEWIQNELKEVRDPNLIEAFKSLLKYRKNKTEISSIDIEEYNASIDRSLDDIAKGNVYTHEQMGMRIKQWAKGQ